MINHKLKTLFLVTMFALLTACGGSGGGSSDPETDPETTPETTPAISQAVIDAAQDALDFLEGSTIDSSETDLTASVIATLQVLFDGFVNALTSSSAISAEAALDVQEALDGFADITAGGSEALTAEQIQAAQDLLDQQV